MNINLDTLKSEGVGITWPVTTQVLWTALKMEPITFLTQAANHVPARAPFQIDIADIPGM